MPYLVIDGAQGEGGGQVLRTALTLSILTQRPIEIVNIRAKRKKPGLLRQHLTSVLAAQAICEASTEGVELGSSRIRFSPGEVLPGDYRFAIGTAGSTVLVCQTILPVLALAKAGSKVEFEGGTHNGMSPSLCFLEQSYLPLLKLMGIDCQIVKSSLGFYPVGGGKWQIEIKPAKVLSPIRLMEPGSESAKKPENCGLHALVSQLPVSIGQREVAAAKTVLGWSASSGIITDVDSIGPGNSFQLTIQGKTHTNLFEVVGEQGLSAERVAKRCAGRVNKFVSAEAAVEEQLADQLLIPMALAGKGSYTTSKPSLHTSTNIEVIKQFMDINIRAEQQNELCWQISISS
ncbi:RNA 3'-terminal phosphate cyclase [Shewanella algae]|uniref:RNA 3'-terminal phosphate cyclase n=1 Tax=Shewanella algae TaxID=38313 RepID=A0A380ABN1_9GAMM|nr:RNA 3'-terminal phosphate cyclase [Shewanella algae]MBO2608953.1 RNA 3'-terminal phosphate cyclase [Shewanella algae]MCE9774167.1 RNA 3'-terminal phosphate cyclase [Shewanella algae]MDL2194370.1 RNA 3'-terminal phosphate cyclase [Shewanella algae]SUI77493.1 RNA 3'-terminal phosphate cyclase [Shewanella algae]